MDIDIIMKDVQAIARSVIDDDEINLTFRTTTNDIAGWDSLNHVQIVSEIQQYFNIKFTASEMISWDNIGDMCTTISLKIRKGI